MWKFTLCDSVLFYESIDQLYKNIKEPFDEFNEDSFLDIESNRDTLKENLGCILKITIRS